MKRSLLAALLLLGVLATASVGHAAVLNITGGSLAVFTFTNPCGSPAHAEPSDPRSNGNGNGGKYDDVIFTLPAGCGGDLQIAVITAGGDLYEFAQTVPARVTIVLDDFLNNGYWPEDATVAATLDGWHLPVVWSPAPVLFGTCEVRDSAGTLVPGSTCTVTDLRVDEPWTTAGSRQTNVYVQTSSNKVSGQVLALSLRLQDARGLPATWAWTTSGIVSPQSQIVPTPGFACASLPALQATTPAEWDGGTKVYYFQLFENRTGVSGLICS